MPSSVTGDTLTDGDTTLQNNTGSNGNGVVMALTPNSDRVTIRVSATVAIGTVFVEVSFDGGATWVGAAAQNLTSGAIVSGVGGLSLIIGTAYYLLWVPPGATNLRARVAALITGNVTVIASERH